MIVHVSGKALIKHAKTGQIYKIESDLLDFDVVAVDERGMGPQTEYSAVIDHPQLGLLSWSLWEYPIGAENYSDTNVGPHELIENLNFELRHEPPDDEEGWQMRINRLVEWFHQHYEDPAASLPYESAEGGYQWIYGHSRDAHEELTANFEDEEDEKIIEAAVKEIESDGVIEWSPIPDYEEEAIAELSSKIDSLPAPQSAPTFGFGDDNQLHISLPPDLQNIASGDIILEELKGAKNDLRQSLTGTNAHISLLDAVKQYNQVFTEGQISISYLYARGIKLENTAFTIRRDIEDGELTPLPLDAEQNLKTVLDLHATYIMSHEKGKELVEAAAAYRQPPQQTEELKSAGEQLSKSVASNPDLFGEDIKEYIASVVEDIGKGPHPERSNQVVVTTFYNLIVGTLKSIGGGAIKISLYSLLGIAIAKSIPGVAALAVGIDIINAVWIFLSSNPLLLKVIVVFAAGDTTWVRPLTYLMDRLKNSLSSHNQK